MVNLPSHEPDVMTENDVRAVLRQAHSLYKRVVIWTSDAIGPQLITPFRLGIVELVAGDEAAQLPERRWRVDHMRAVVAVESIEGESTDYGRICDSWEADWLESIDAVAEDVVSEIARVFPSPVGFEGTQGQYSWLLKNVGVSEEDDVHWQLIFEDMNKLLNDDDRVDEEVLELLCRPDIVFNFLWDIRAKYRACSLVYQDANQSES